MSELKNKVALVTGGASGVGLAYAKELLRNGLKGVALVDINNENGNKAVDEILEEFKRTDCVIFIKTDITNGKQLEDAFETTIKTFHQLDILINNAGIFHELQVEKCIDVNLVAVIKGSMLAIEKYFPKYKSGLEGLIVNTASIAGLQPVERTPTYTATKFGVVGFTRAMGGDVRYQVSNTRMIAICPTLVYTPMCNATEDCVPEPFLSMIADCVKNKPGQTPEELAKKVIPIISDAPNGSVWTVTTEGCNKVEFPSFNLNK